MANIKQVKLSDGTFYDLNDGSWELFQTVTGDGQTMNFQFTDLDFTEFLFVATGVYNNSTSTNSAVNIVINDFKIGALDSPKDGGTTTTKNQVLHMKYNGLFWDAFRGMQSNNAENYYSSFSNAAMPYAFRMNVGKCTKLALTSNSPTYCWAGGTIQIYAR